MRNVRFVPIFVAEVVGGRNEVRGWNSSASLSCRLLHWERRLGWRGFSARYAASIPAAAPYPGHMAAMGGGFAVSLAIGAD